MLLGPRPLRSACTDSIVYKPAWCDCCRHCGHKGASTYRNFLAEQTDSAVAVARFSRPLN